MKRIKRTQKDFAWTTWGPREIKQALDQYLEKVQSDIEAMLSIPDTERTFENTFWAFEVAGHPFHNYGHFFSALSFCSPKASVRDAARQAIVKIQEGALAIVHRPEVYAALKACKLKKSKLEPDAKKLVEDTLEGFRRAGFDLSARDFSTFKKNTKKMYALSVEFEKNIADYDAQLSLPTKVMQSFDLPKSYLSTLKQQKGTYLIGSVPAQAIPFLQYCPDPRWRKKLMQLIAKKGGTKNLTILKELLLLRKANAQLLGFKNHAEYMLADRMAGTPRHVHNFEGEIYTAVRPLVKNDLTLLKKTKKQDIGSSELNAWDLEYYGRLLRKEKFDLDAEEVRQYFQLENVLEAMFGIAQKLFGITIHQKHWKLWHADTRSYELKKGKQVIGYIVMDLHPRTGKYTHAMANNVYDPGVYTWGGDTYESPVTIVVCNFRSPTKKLPSLLSFDEVTTLFHEFGHALHNTLTDVRISSQAGLETYLDFVELPSQIFEEWAWLPATMKKMSSHVMTGEKLPKALIENLTKSRTFLNGLFLGRQIAFSQFDMSIHERLPNKSLNEIGGQFVKKYTMIPLITGSLFPASFAHIAGGYDAGYYSYLWSRVYAYDCFSVFKENNPLSSSIGKKYWKEILAPGSSRHEMESLKAFLGRKPSAKAFIRHLKSLS